MVQFSGMRDRVSVPTMDAFRVLMWFTAKRATDAHRSNLTDHVRLLTGLENTSVRKVGQEIGKRSPSVAFAFAAAFLRAAMMLASFSVVIAQQLQTSSMRTVPFTARHAVRSPPLAIAGHSVFLLSCTYYSRYKNNGTWSQCARW